MQINTEVFKKYLDPEEKSMLIRCSDCAGMYEGSAQSASAKRVV
jgi:hypothetical protein